MTEFLPACEGVIPQKKRSFGREKIDSIYRSIYYVEVTF